MQKILVLLLLVSLFGFSCKESERDEDTLTNTSEENAFAEAIYADAFKIVNQAALGAAGISNAKETDTSLFGCDDVIVDTTGTNQNILIDFKFKGCLASHGFTRKGRISADFTGVYPDSNSTVTIKFLNYSFGIYSVDGRLSIVNRGKNDQGNPLITFFLQNGSISNERTTISWQGNKTWEQIAGSGDSIPENDVFQAIGTSFGTNRNGNSFDTEVEKANHINYDCFHFSSGITNLNVKNLANRKLDYGSGNCDQNAVVTINGKDHNITLPL